MIRPYPSEFIETNYTKHYLMGCVPEESVQADILTFLALKGIPAVAIDAGAKKLRGRAFRALGAAGFRDPGKVLAGQTGAGMEGFPDILGILPGSGRALFLEVKAPKWAGLSERTGKLISLRGPGMPSAAQLAFLDTAHAAGALVGVVWSLRDAEAILDGPQDRSS